MPGEMRGSGQLRLNLLLGVVLVLLFLLSLFVGSNPVPVIQALMDSINRDPSVISLILTEVRLPRALIALLAGATLGVCGAAM